MLTQEWRKIKPIKQHFPWCGKFYVWIMRSDQNVRAIKITIKYFNSRCKWLGIYGAIWGCHREKIYVDIFSYWWSYIVQWERIKVSCWNSLATKDSLTALETYDDLTWLLLRPKSANQPTGLPRWIELKDRLIWHEDLCKKQTDGSKTCKAKRLWFQQRRKSSRALATEARLQWCVFHLLSWPRQRSHSMETRSQGRAALWFRHFFIT